MKISDARAKDNDPLPATTRSPDAGLVRRPGAGHRLRCLTAALSEQGQDGLGRPGDTVLPMENLHLNKVTSFCIHCALSVSSTFLVRMGDGVGRGESPRNNFWLNMHFVAKTRTGLLLLSKIETTAFLVDIHWKVRIEGYKNYGPEWQNVALDTTYYNFDSEMEFLVVGR